MITPQALMTEAGVLAILICGFLASRALGRRWHFTEVMIMYTLGLLFEILTSHMWRYHNIFLLLPLLCAEDISILFPLAWAGLVMTATAMAEYIWRRHTVTRMGRHAIMMLVWFLIGNIFETLFYNVGVIEYVRDEHTAINFRTAPRRTGPNHAVA